MPDQEAKSDNLGIFFYFLHNNCMLTESTINEAILMSTHNIQFHDKIRIFP